MTRTGIGQLLVGLTALSSILIPVGVDGVLLSRLHMRNPRWLPHAKLHCAMSFHAALALGAGALAVLWAVPPSDTGAMALAAFLATAFWAGLIAAGFWPGASYGMEGDPGMTAKPPVLFGRQIDPNVMVAGVSVLLGWTGFLLLWGGAARQRRPALGSGVMLGTSAGAARPVPSIKTGRPATDLQASPPQSMPEDEARMPEMALGMASHSKPEVTSSAEHAAEGEPTPMKLYVMPGACSLASHIALVWAGAPYELAVLSHAEVGGEGYRKLNPKGAVPALALDDGTVITESLAVLEYIADSYPDARLDAAPGSVLERARLNEALAELVSDVHKAWAPVFAPGRYVMQEANQDDAKQAAFAQLDKQYARLDQRMQGQEWLLFGRRTVADAYLYVMCRWKDRSPTPLARYPALAAFKARLDADEEVQRALGEEPTG